MEIQFLDLNDVLMIHADQIAHYGGNAAVRDKGLLESAVAMPRMSFAGQWAHDDLFAMAAAYLFHIVLNHPFVDGNKRTAVVCAIAFLALNDIHVKPDNEALAEFVLSAAQGLKDKDQIAAFLKEHADPLA